MMLALRLVVTATFLSFLRIYWIAWAVGLVSPGQVGDLATVGTNLSRRGVDWRGTVGRSLLDKGITLSVMLLFAAAALADTWHRSSPL